MNYNLTVAEARKLSKTEIEHNLGERAKKLEELGMDHVTACDFVSGIMNLGIAANELWNRNNKEL